MKQLMYYTGVLVWAMIGLWLAYHALTAVGRLMCFFMNHINPAFGILGLIAVCFYLVIRDGIPKLKQQTATRR